MLIANIFQDIKQNGFENSALKFSVADSSTEKGSLGWINLGILSQKVKNAVKVLQPGQVSKPIIQPNSILFLKLNSLRDSQNKINNELIKKNIISQKKNELFNLYSRSHLSKLKNNHLIQYQ